MTTTYTGDLTGLGHVVGDGNEYVWGGGLIGRVTAANVTTYAHSDGLGSVRLLTDSAGASFGRQAYDAFGATRSQTGTQLALTYTGERVGSPHNDSIHQPLVRRAQLAPGKFDRAHVGARRVTTNNTRCAA